MRGDEVQRDTEPSRVADEIAHVLSLLRARAADAQRWVGVLEGAGGGSVEREVAVGVAAHPHLVPHPVRPGVERPAPP